MKNYFMLEFLLNKTGKYVFGFFTAVFFLLITFNKSLSEENVFILDSIEVKGSVDLNFF